MLLQQAIILAGGLGTRLKSAVPDLPKCMAIVNGKPFIHYVIRHLQRQNVQHFVFSLGYKHEFFTSYLHSELQPHQFTICIESEPLGTGGAIKYAAGFCHQQHAIVTNGDTLFETNLSILQKIHEQQQALVSLSLKPMQKFDRYGAVQITNDGKVTAFNEKKYYEEGLINGGVYAVDLKKFTETMPQQKFSFEKDYLEAFVHKGKFYGSIQDEYFIDIGIPEDYHRAIKEIKP